MKRPVYTVSMVIELRIKCHLQTFCVHLKITTIKGIPGCFLPLTSLLKSSNNLELICNNANIKYSRLVLFRNISVTNTLTV